MNANQSQNVDRTVVAPRRKFIRNSLLLTVPAMFGGTAFQALAAVYTPPNRENGSTVVSVRDFGAVGNGVQDDTVAFQNAINSLPASGGTVNVPAGTYLINPVRKVRLRSNMHLQMSPDAVLKAKANGEPRAYVLMVHRVTDVEISGGRIVGDRDQHFNDEGQWGHGIMIRGSQRVTVRDIHISRCFGDGISIGAVNIPDAPTLISEDVVISNVVCTGCRRQGLTIGRSHAVRVYDSEFSDTHGHLPECGINIEPDAPGTDVGTSFVHIENCLIRKNAANGIQVYKNTSGVTIKRNKIEYNDGYGVLTIGSEKGYVALNHLRHNRLQGLSLSNDSHGYIAAGNRFRNNRTVRQGINTAPPVWTALTGIYESGPNRNTSHVLVSSGSTGCEVRKNYYSD